MALREVEYPIVHPWGNSYYDITGHRFGRLVVLERVVRHKNPNGRHRYWWKCICDCGTYHHTTLSSLSWKTVSCGCYQRFRGNLCNGLKAMVIDYKNTTENTTSTIGKIFGISKNSVIGILDRAGMCKRKTDPEIIEERVKPICFPPHNECVYPHGHPGEPGFKWCCSPIRPGSRYCEEHHKLIYIDDKEAKRRSAIAAADFSRAKLALVVRN